MDRGSARRGPIDWAEVEQLVFAAFTGERLSEEEQRKIEEAHAREPAEYRVRSERVRQAERDRLRSM